MRIIAGKHRGRKLIDCSHLKGLRPTTDANRENLFNIILSSKKIAAIGFDINEANVLDVFSGSGAVSLEALSRGAKFATLIDNNRYHLEIAEENAELLKENLECFCFDISRSIFKTTKKYNLIFIDPPYSKNLVNIALKNLNSSNCIQKNALVIIEHHQNELLDIDENEFLNLEVKKYKETVFSFFVKL